MADTCPHGFPPADCLICQTLGTGATPGRPPGQVSTPTQPPYYGPGAAPRGEQAVRPDAVYPAGTSQERRTFGSRVGWALVILALIMVAAWMLAGALFALVRLIELFVVAAAAGWVGFRLGVHRGRRSGG